MTYTLIQTSHGTPPPTTTAINGTRQTYEHTYVSVHNYDLLISPRTFKIKLTPSLTRPMRWLGHSSAI